MLMTRPTFTIPYRFFLGTAYNGTVRRVSAFVLLAIFSFSMIATAALNTLESNLPECCRKDGKHKCAMSSASMQTMQQSEEIAFRPAGEKCPTPPNHGASLRSDSFASLHRATADTSVSLASHPSGVVQTEARYRASFSRTRQKRGPPSLLS